MTSSHSSVRLGIDLTVGEAVGKAPHRARAHFDQGVVKDVSRQTLGDEQGAAEFELKAALGDSWPQRQRQTCPSPIFLVDPRFGVADQGAAVPGQLRGWCGCGESNPDFKLGKLTC